jgi:hypothetical protein
LGFVVEPEVESDAEPEPELMSEAEPFLAFFADFLLAFFECFECFMLPVESLFVVELADEVSLEPEVEPVEPVEPVWAKAPNEASAKAESAATIVRIMLISFMFLSDRCRTGWCRQYSKAHAVFFGEIFPAGTRFGRVRRIGVTRTPRSCSISPQCGPKGR